MPVITPTKINDLVQTTLRKLGRRNFTQIATSLQKYVAFNELILNNRAEEREGGGYGFQWDVMVTHYNSAQNTGLGAPDAPFIPDMFIQGQADWRFTTAHYAYLEQELDMNQGESRIVDLIQGREIGCRIGTAERMERNWFGPPVSASDEVTPQGLKTWIVKNSSEGFNGGAPSGHTTIGGINPSTYTNWKNYTFQYIDLTESDGIDKWVRAARKCNFEPPMDVNAPTFNTGNKWRYLVNEPTISTLERYLKASNENLGVDLARYMNAVMFNRVPVLWCPLLDADTTNPIYGVNFGEFKTMILKGWWGREKMVNPYADRHNLIVYFKDYLYNWVTRDRRCHFVGATGTSEPS